MEKLKLISVRIDTETLKKIDAIGDGVRYWKRNTIINGILTAVVDAMDKKSLYNMMRYCRRYDGKPEGSFTLLKDKTH